MPSPFPGMDPYLEAPDVFPGLHDRLIIYLGESIQGRLPGQYYAEVSDRVWVETSRRPIGPGVTIRRLPGEPEGSVATISLLAPGAVVVTVPHDERREPFVQIFAGDDRLVTTIEVLSPANKNAGSQARELYLQKQQEILASQVNLVEIDLLRSGAHATAVALDWALRRTGPFDYHVSVHRYPKWAQFEVYPIRLRDPLPEIAIPLLPEDADVKIDLQAVFDRAYETGPYRRRIHYDRPPHPSLSTEDAAWAEQRLSAMKGH